MIDEITKDDIRGLTYTDYYCDIRINTKDNILDIIDRIIQNQKLRKLVEERIRNCQYPATEYISGDSYKELQELLEKSKQTEDWELNNGVNGGEPNHG